MWLTWCWKQFVHFIFIKMNTVFRVALFSNDAHMCSWVWDLCFSYFKAASVRLASNCVHSYYWQHDLSVNDIELRMSKSNSVRSMHVNIHWIYIGSRFFLQHISTALQCKCCISYCWHVSPSAICWYCCKMTQAKVTRSSLMDSPRILVFEMWVYPEIWWSEKYFVIDLVVICPVVKMMDPSLIPAVPICCKKFDRWAYSSFCVLQLESSFRCIWSSVWLECHELVLYYS